MKLVKTSTPSFLVLMVLSIAPRKMDETEWKPRPASNQEKDEASSKT